MEDARKHLNRCHTVPIIKEVQIKIKNGSFTFAFGGQILKIIKISRLHDHRNQHPCAAKLSGYKFLKEIWQYT